jgi:homoserine O-acetyltransferase/O-succinyltransferase
MILNRILLRPILRPLSNNHHANNKLDKMTKKIYTYGKKFLTEKGSVLKNLRIAYHTYGTLNEKKDNVVWVCHALTGSSDVFEWWPGLFGKNDLFNPEEHFIVCANITSSCYGSTGPLSYNTDTDRPYFHDFPDITVRDIVNTLDLLRIYLNINKIRILIGGSLGGFQALEWGILRPEVIDNLVLIACGAKISPWATAFNESQRMAIECDPTWRENRSDAGMEGMKTARSIALLSYRNYITYNYSQSEISDDLPEKFRASGYQRYQGLKLSKRFNAFSYYCLSKVLDSHNVGRNRKSVTEALSIIKARTIVIGIDTDILFPATEQKYLTLNIPGAKYYEIQSHFGHDGFLTETHQLTELLSGIKHINMVHHKNAYLNF